MAHGRLMLLRTVYFYESSLYSNLAVQSELIVPDSIHAESLLANLQPRNPSQELVMPPVNLHSAFFVVRKRKPLV